MHPLIDLAVYTAVVLLLGKVLTNRNEVRGIRIFNTVLLGIAFLGYSKSAGIL